MDILNFIDAVFTHQDDEHIDITKKQLEDIRNHEPRQARLEVLNQMDEDLKDKLRKKEVLTYSRRNKVSITPPQEIKISASTSSTSSL
jgi:hypothetical protein